VIRTDAYQAKTRVGNEDDSDDEDKFQQAETKADIKARNKFYKDGIGTDANQAKFYKDGIGTDGNQAKTKAGDEDDFHQAEKKAELYKDGIGTNANQAKLYKDGIGTDANKAKTQGW
jgi:hypothetical protein